ncbi:MAG: hypothetical protein DLD55_02365 [candidate division SR1 bacterium]|nr:MAG: hypothetical protein DLD55_02365 [candidate division SR1 bacterium]
MITKIKTELAQAIALKNKQGIFFSAFDAEGKLLASNGVIKTDRSLETIIESFYKGLMAPIASKIKRIIFDIVEEIRLENDPNVLVKVPLDQYGIFLVEGEGQNSGILLPNTKGITTIQQGLAAIKKKYNLKNQVSVYIFKTKKIEIQF